MNSTGKSGVLVLPHFIQVLPQMWCPLKNPLLLHVPTLQTAQIYISLQHYIFLLGTCHCLKIYTYCLLVCLFLPLDCECMSVRILSGLLLYPQSHNAQNIIHDCQIFVERMSKWMMDSGNTICHNGNMKTLHFSQHSLWPWVDWWAGPQFFFFNSFYTFLKNPFYTLRLLSRKRN